MHSDIVTSYKQYLEEIPENVLLLAVSKHHPESSIQLLYNTGCRCFGENKVQELVAKYESLPKDIKWHFIGHLQTNKVKYLAPFVELIHGVDSLKLLKAINKEAKKNDRIIDCLLQVKVAEEESKFGLSIEDARSLYKDSIETLENVRVVGLMGMATKTTDQEKIRSEFRLIKDLLDSLNDEFGRIDVLKELSIGMSKDYPIAIEEGSTMLRMGTSIFGQRVY